MADMWLLKFNLLNTFIRQRVAADKYNIQLVIHTRQHKLVIHIRRHWTEIFKSNTIVILIKYCRYINIRE